MHNCAHENRWSDEKYLISCRIEIFEWQIWRLNYCLSMEVTEWEHTQIHKLPSSVTITPRGCALSIMTVLHPYITHTVQRTCFQFKEKKSHNSVLKHWYHLHKMCYFRFDVNESALAHVWDRLMEEEHSRWFYFSISQCYNVISTLQVKGFKGVVCVFKMKLHCRMP